MLNKYLHLPELNPNQKPLAKLRRPITVRKKRTLTMVGMFNCTQDPGFNGLLILSCIFLLPSNNPVDDLPAFIADHSNLQMGAQSWMFPNRIHLDETGF
jgi:hypothetical protein